MKEIVAMKASANAMRAMLLFLLLVFTAIGCEYLSMEVVDSRLKINNRSADTLLALANLNFPDSSVLNVIPYEVKPNDTTGLSIVNRSWQDVVDSTGGLTIFFASYSDWVQFGGDREQYQILDTRQLTRSELDSLNWIVSYPH